MKRVYMTYFKPTIELYIFLKSELISLLQKYCEECVLFLSNICMLENDMVGSSACDFGRGEAVIRVTGKPISL